MTSMPVGLPAPDEPGGASVTLYENGPLILRGDVALLAMDGTEIEPGRRTVALCRCGFSAIKPFCDGSHRRAGFRAAGGDERTAAQPSRPDPHLRTAPAVQERPSGGGVEGQAAARAPQDV
jgi:CDGSH-type Zn-finger protein